MAGEKQESQSRMQREPGSGTAGEGNEDVIRRGKHGIGGNSVLELSEEGRPEAAAAERRRHRLLHLALVTQTPRTAAFDAIRRRFRLPSIAGISTTVSACVAAGAAAGLPARHGQHRLNLLIRRRRSTT